MKKVFYFIVSLLCICSCTSQAEKARKALSDAKVDRPTWSYFLEFENTKDDPVVFAEELINGNYDDEIKEWYPKSGRVGIDEAFENKWIRYGMTYEQLKEVIGPAEDLTRRNGMILYAYYKGTRLQFCFDDGYLDHWNEH